MTVMITCFHPFVSRNLFAAPFFNELKERSGLRIVIVCPEKKRDFLQREYGAANVVIVGVPGRIRRLDALFKDIAISAVRTRSLYIMRKMRLGFEREWIIRILSPFARAARPFIPFVYWLLMPRHAYADIFKTYHPSLVFTADIFGSADCRIAHEAKCRGVRTIGMVRSWDNLTTKGGFRVVPDILVVNNEVIKKEAVLIHRIPEQIIRVVGVPHYDRYICKLRNSVQKELNSRGKRCVLYAPLGDRIIKVGEGELGKGFDDAMIRLLAQNIPDTHIILVRLPPTDTVSLGTLPANVIVERPGTALGTSVAALKTAELSANDDRHLVETICASDVVLTVFSSIAVDALVLQKPVILIGFDPTEKPYWESVARLHELDHMQPLIVGGIPVAHSEEGLRRTLGKYLAQPDSDRATRNAVAEQQAYRLDQKSSERLLRVILEALMK